MLTYTPKYGVLVNKINNWDTGNSVLNSSRFVQDINGPTQPSYKTLEQLEAEGIWFIYKIHYTVPYQRNNIFIDNWGAIWTDRMNDNSIFKKHSGLSAPMPDICIENIVSKKWPLPSGLISDEISTAIHVYVSMFLDLEKANAELAILKSTDDVVNKVVDLESEEELLVFFETRK
jgi:hypothetical protein